MTIQTNLDSIRRIRGVDKVALKGSRIVIITKRIQAKHPGWGGWRFRYKITIDTLYEYPLPQVELFLGTPGLRWLHFFYFRAVKRFRRHNTRIHPNVCGCELCMGNLTENFLTAVQECDYDIAANLAMLILLESDTD